MWSSIHFSYRCSSVLLILHFVLLISVADSGKLNRPFNNTISAVLVFGDSTVDSGNNNFIKTPFRSNFPPYGSNFFNRVPTGRFTDGRLATDFIASYAGIKECVPPYLDPNLSTEDLMTGVSFASAGSGFDPLTAEILGVIPIQKQLEYFREYKRRLEVTIGKQRTKTLISKAAVLISCGTNDLIVNYFGPPFRRIFYDITSYQQFLLQHVQQFIQGLRREGAQLIAMVGLPPIGCLPIVITVHSNDRFHQRPCIDSLSTVALDYNQKLKKMLTDMQDSGFTILYGDIYKPISDMIEKPHQFGFDKVNVGCCGSGLVETTFLCNEGSVVCDNPSQYVFFDSVHPTQAAYKYLFDYLRPVVDLLLENYRPH